MCLDSLQPLLRTPALPFPVDGHYDDSLSCLQDLFSIGHVIGSGAFGVVRRATRRSDEAPVAIKYVAKNRARHLKFVTIDCPTGPHRFPAEVLTSGMVAGTPGLLSLLGFYELEEQYVYVFQRLKNGDDLFEYLHRHWITPNRYYLEGSMVRRLFRQIVNVVGLCYLQRIVHRDLKVENLMIDMSDLTVRLIDFGAAAVVKDTLFSDFNGTGVDAPPEYVVTRRYHGWPQTAWCLGIILHHLAYGDRPFDNDEEILAGLKGSKFDKRPPAYHISTSCRSLIEWLLQGNPSRRPASCNQILSHAFLRGL